MIRKFRDFLCKYYKATSYVIGYEIRNELYVGTHIEVRILYITYIINNRRLYNFRFRTYLRNNLTI